MTRINTNVSSLIAQNTLSKSHAALDQSLTRLSTGLRINTGKDDPAGLIASENLRSDITAITKAISNTDRANEVIATADSGLGQASDLLNNIRGLVTEASNSGAEGSDQIAADQLQIDQSLKALNQIAQTVTFQGRKLLDGSLDFITQGGTNANQLGGTTINQANLGATGSVAVNVAVTSAATKASLNITGIAASTTAANATTNLTVTNTAAQGTALLTTDSTNSAAFTLTAKSTGAAAGATGNGAITLAIVDAGSGGTESASYNATSHVLTATVDLTANASVTHLASVIGAGADFSTSGVTNGTDTVAATNAGAGTVAGGRNAGSATITVNAKTAGASANGKTVTLVEDSTITNNTAVAAEDGSGNVTVKVHGTVTKNAIADGDQHHSRLHCFGHRSIRRPELHRSERLASGSAATLGLGADASGGLASAAQFELSGANGAEVLSSVRNTSAQTIVDAINAVSDATGVSAAISGTTISLTSTKYGSSQFVSLKPQNSTTIGSISGDIRVRAPTLLPR